MKKIKSGKWDDVVPTLSTFLQTHLTRVDLIDLPESGAPRLVLELRSDSTVYISRGGPIYIHAFRDVTPIGTRSASKIHIKILDSASKPT